jgi:hypothetical protein
LGGGMGVGTKAYDGDLIGACHGWKML